MSVRNASAIWSGGLKGGGGRMALGSGVWEGPYSFSTRFGDEPGTNPEELVAAAHAGCFSMALAAALDKAGFAPKSVATKAKAHLEILESGPTITRIELTTEASVPGIEEAVFQDLAAQAKANCPVSKALAGVDIQLKATLS
ncbi:MAG: OsmC family peroxiredoxin [Thermoanaerobaculia bacterium]|nr:OsmC family peroxiredoxin [Thermoanaerobaculia bacterium]